MTSAISIKRTGAQAAAAAIRNLPSDRVAHGMAGRALSWAAVAWFVVTVLGQMMFVAYVAVVYGGAAVEGNLAGWNKVMPHGYVAGDTAGNLAIGAHLLMAAVIMIGGALQLVPQVRRIAPRFHTWNGRVYLAGAVLASVTGLYMLIVRGTVGGPLQHLGTGLNALVILLCAGLTLRHAVARQFSVHERWAWRLFMAVSGVWFFRVGLMFWIAVNGGPVGFDPVSFQGPVLSFLAFAQYLLPLFVLELYFRCRDGGNTWLRTGMALALVVLTVATALGTGVATMGMWLPHF
jgi:hypothetical protein